MFKRNKSYILFVFILSFCAIFFYLVLISWEKGFIAKMENVSSDNLLKKPSYFSLKHIFTFGTCSYSYKYRFLSMKNESEYKLSLYKGPFKILKRSMRIRRLSDHSRNLVKELIVSSKYSSNSFMFFEWDHVNVDIPDIEDKETVISMAEIASNAYVDVPNTGDWIDVGGGLDIVDDDSWNKTALHGHVFIDDQNKTVIIALKGTSPELFGVYDPTTGIKDKINDNLLFSCCCGRVSWIWTPVCNCFNGIYSCDQRCLEKELLDESHYYMIALNIFYNVSSIYPEANVWMVGHSLGGALSSLVGLTFGLPTVTFEAPGEKLAAKRLHLPFPPGLPDDESYVWHFGHTADPIFMGTCNGPKSTCWYGGYAMETHCHSGLSCIYDIIADKGWKMAIGTHRIKQVIDIIKDYEDVPKCNAYPDCVDCPGWTFYDGPLSTPSIKTFG